VANRVLAIRLVQWLGWVFETQEIKKERKQGLVKEPLFTVTEITELNLVFLSNESQNPRPESTRVATLLH